MNKTPLVSIIIPIYNVEKYLDKCITTVVYQTYKNLEIILVDDGSTDSSSSICDKWAKKDSRIKVIHKKNGGLSDARNVGITYATGEYLYFIDSDDWVSINLIQRMVKLAEHDKADMIIFQFAYVYSDGRTVRNYNSNKEKKVINRKNTYLLLMDDLEITNHVWRKFYRRSLVPERVFPKGKNFEDMFSMPWLIKPCKKIEVVNDCLYFYRVNDEGIVKTLTLKNFKDRFDGICSEFDNIQQIEPTISQQVKSVKTEKIIGLTMDLFKSDLPKGEKNYLLQNIKKVLGSVRISNIKNKRDKLKWALIMYCPNLLNYIDKYKEHELETKKRKAKISSQKLINKYLSTIKSSDPKFVILATPSYGNLGDQALKFGEYRFIKEYFPNYKIVSIPLDILDDVKEVVKKFIGSQDIIALQAGGNIGTMYPGIHRTQQKAISLFRDHKIIIFPQTFYFDNTLNGKAEIKKTYSIYKSCKDLTIFVRDQFSHNFLKEKMPSLKVFLKPDMALMLPFDKRKVKRNGVLLLLRNDGEKTLSLSEEQKVLEVIEKDFTSVVQADTHIYMESITNVIAKESIRKLFNKYDSTQLAITDRLHGMIFAFLTNTPCIVLESKSPKIKGVYSWIKESSDNIILLDDLNNLNETILSLTELESLKNNKKIINEEFKSMAELIEFSN